MHAVPDTRAAGGHAIGDGREGSLRVWESESHFLLKTLSGFSTPVPRACGARHGTVGSVNQDFGKREILVRHENSGSDGCVDGLWAWFGGGERGW